MSRAKWWAVVVACGIALLSLGAVLKIAGSVSESDTVGSQRQPNRALRA